MFEIAFMLQHNFCLIFIYLFALVLLCFGARIKLEKICFENKKKGRRKWAAHPLLGPRPRTAQAAAAAQPRPQQPAPRSPPLPPPAAADAWAPRVGPTAFFYLRPKRNRRNGRLRLPCRARIEDPSPSPPI